MLRPFDLRQVNPLFFHLPKRTQLPEFVDLGYDLVSSVVDLLNGGKATDAESIDSCYVTIAIGRYNSQ